MKITVPLVVAALIGCASAIAAPNEAVQVPTPTSIGIGSETNPPAIEDTNTVALKDLMSSNNIVTNTIGTILVKVSPTLWVGKYEVTQKEYSQVAGSNPSAFKGDDKPVDSVSWNDAMAFCQKLTDQERDQLPAGYGYSLPTETQWQMLAANVDIKDAVMKLNGDRNTTSHVGSLGPSPAGLYDLRGNVMEWCYDSANPASKVLRGGAWDTFVEPSARLEFRNWAPADEKKNDYGFRIVLETGQ